MKAVIIGGGIAGLTLGLILKNKNFEVVVHERAPGISPYGHAFLMHEEGLSILRNLNNGAKPKLTRNSILNFSLKRPDETLIKSIELDSWQCYKRNDIIRYLYSLYPNGIIKEGQEFSHFIYSNG
ncbi:MAG: NAD(P)-binding protein, partial [Bacteroidetes bacterium]|nr:NAD(P)-binding protein [Bacteroidota bacterium]